MSALDLTAADRTNLRATHADIFRESFWKSWGFLLAVVVTILYLIGCWHFFGVGNAIANGKWDRASLYLQDWYSWRAQPRLRFEGDAVNVTWSSRGQYPDGMPIEWLLPQTDGSLDILYGSEADRIEVTPSVVTVHIGGAAYPVTITPERSLAPADAPPGLVQDGDKVVVNYGWAGSAEIRTNQVYVQRRFFGWANFFFDPNSKLWGKSLGDIVVGPEIEPGTSNLALALRDFLGNTTWQHADILSKLLQTLVMAFVGTLLATLIAFPLAFVAARNITRSKPVNWLMKRGFDFLRSIDMLIWALFFTRSFGPGPIPGIAAIFFTDTGALGKVYAEALENVDDRQREGVKSVGASGAAVNRYGVVPQVLPVFLGQSLYFWESNIRSATVIGAVGAGGIGLKLLEAMQTNSDWDKVAYMVLLILAVVFIFDNISNFLRSKLIGPTGH